MSAPLTLFIVTGEHSGDALGGKLMAALKRHHAGPIRFLGVGDAAMAAEGLASLYPMTEVAVMGPLAILKRLPWIVRRVYQTVDAALAAEPDAVIIIDAPEFTHPIAKRIRKRAPQIPIIDYVSPTVWAWRPGRARKMRPYVDHLLALLPFEPEAHARLGGPPCSYVGHPLIERLEGFRSHDPGALGARLGLDPGKPVIVVLPGSRSSEVVRLMEPFGAALRLLQEAGRAFEVIIPVVPHVRGLVEAGLADWPVVPHLVEGEADKLAAFRLGRVALAASGTVTLELALMGTPMVVAYRVDGVAAQLRFLLKVHSVVLANLVLGENAFPEYLQEDCVPDKLAAAVSELLVDSPAWHAQRSALDRIPDKMRLPAGTPSDRAAAIVLDTIGLSGAGRPGEPA
ncbi:MAG: lipid-A-disaccharide synthase [Hyphomicrobiaceae bacterium]